MSKHTLGVIVFALYVLLMYCASLIRPRKCSECETPEDKYKAAIAAPFVTVLMSAMAIGCTWATIEVFFQP